MKFKKFLVMGVGSLPWGKFCESKMEVFEVIAAPFE